MSGRRRYAPLALALIALQIAASIAGLEHAGVRHVVCAEDGAMIDAPAAPIIDGAPDDDSLGAGGDHARPNGHDHCALAAADDDAIAPALLAVVAAPAPISRVPAAAPALVAPRAVRPLSVAPKTSPPV
jgi:hypothetical protein